MQRCKSPRQAQRFLSAHNMIYGHFRPQRHLMTAAQVSACPRRRFRGSGSRRPTLEWGCDDAAVTQGSPERLLRIQVSNASA